MDPQEKLTAWLKDAYAMEKNMEEALEHHIKDARDFPDLRDRLEQHLRETRDHAARVSACLESLEEESSIKEAAASITGLAQAVSTARLGDGVMQNVLRDYAGEHFEIA